MGLRPPKVMKTPRSGIRSLWNRYPFLVIPTEAYPDFLPRSTGNDRVCGFR
jgi:hypothetical protein